MSEIIDDGEHMRNERKGLTMKRKLQWVARKDQMVVQSCWLRRGCRLDLEVEGADLKWWFGGDKVAQGDSRAVVVGVNGCRSEVVGGS